MCQLKKLVKMNVLEEGFTNFSSRVMLVPKNETKDNRVCIDIWEHLIVVSVIIIIHTHLLNIICKQYVVLVQKCLVLKIPNMSSGVLRLSTKNQRYCSVVCYLGGPHYKAKKLVMGLIISLDVWIQTSDERYLFEENGVLFKWMICVC